MLVSVCRFRRRIGWLASEVTRLPARYSDRMFEKEAAARAAVASLPAPHSPARNWFSASSHFHVFAAVTVAATAIRKLSASVGFPFDWLHVGILNHFCGLWSPLSGCGHSPKPCSNIESLGFSAISARCQLILSIVLLPVYELGSARRRPPIAHRKNKRPPVLLPPSFYSWMKQATF